jgi:hypothetical protein
VVERERSKGRRLKMEEVTAASPWIQALVSLLEGISAGETRPTVLLQARKEHLGLHHCSITTAMLEQQFH